MRVFPLPKMVSTSPCPRSKYKTELQPVVFLAASDDPPWLKENLAHDSDVNFNEDLFGKNPISVTSQQMTSKKLTLKICHHWLLCYVLCPPCPVLTFNFLFLCRLHHHRHCLDICLPIWSLGPGTFGQWGALLAGGEVVYPTGWGQPLRSQFFKGLANWRRLNLSTFSQNSPS